MTSQGALSYEDALAGVLRLAGPLGSERVALAESLGRALAEPVVSRVSLPPWDNAGMDGYAVRRDDVRGASATRPITLPVVGSIAAGAHAASLAELVPGTSFRIMTGAPVPPCTEAIIRVEDTDRGTERVSITDDRDLAGRANIRPRGEEIAAGADAFAAGTSISATHIGVLASIGCASPLVHRRPRVALISGGDELVLLDRFDEVLDGHRIISSSSYALPALLTEAGATVRTLPLVRDTLHDTVAAVTSALDEGCDLLVTTGGVSVGAHDYTRDALEAVGGEIGFWRARIRPGGPIGTGTVRGVPWLGLPGNPVSSMVTGQLFACPLVRRLGGHAQVRRVPVAVRMLDAVDTVAPLTHFLRVIVQPTSDGVLEARMAGPQGSNLLRTMALANAVLEVPESDARTAPGSMYRAILFPGASWQ